MIGPELSDEVVLDVEVAYALPDRQLIVPLQVPQGTTVLEAALLSGIADEFEGLDPQQCKIGVFGQVVNPNQPLRTGQRVEIYRPLKADPREARRQLAAAGKTMGRSRQDPG
ncbi:MAG: RnfH family protein [Gammaproteobacteria bacterium]|nr:RnfH family protein [Gammaproteobacteria bacterium]MDH3767336.1 RnfH family protein [Gammaproteobacteria bacterium]